jgi:AsmA protein
MSKAVKWILGIFLFLAVLAVLIPIGLSLFIDPNDYKETIARKVREETGRSLTIPGRIDLDFSLVGLQTVFEMGEVRLSSSPRFPDTGFFSSNHVEINLALWPLIKNKELQVNRIRLDGVSVNLVRDEQGVTNWEDLAGGKGGDEPAADRKTGEPGKGLAAIDIGGIQARNISVTYDDRQAGRTVSLNNLNLDLGRIRQGHPFPFKANFELLAREKGQEPLSARFNAISDVTFSLSDQHYSLDGFILDGTVRDDSLPAGEIDFEVAAEIDAQMKQQKVDIRKLIINRGDLEIKAMLTLTGLDNPQVKGSLKVPPFSPRKQSEAFGVALPVKNPEALAEMSADLDFSGSLKEFKVGRMHLTVDETNAEGSMTIMNLLQPSYDLALHIDRLDLDKYTREKPPEPEPESQEPGEEETEAAVEEEPQPALPAPQPGEEADPVILPAGQLRGLNYSANIKIDRMQAAGLSFTNILLKTNGRDGLIRLEPFAADFYDGAVNVTAEIDARRDTPAVHVVKDLQGVSLGPLFADLTGREEITGQAVIHADITSSGVTRDTLTRNANGRMNLSLADGEIARLKIIDTIRTAKALLGSRDKKEEPSGTGTEPGPEETPDRTQAVSGRPTTFASLQASGVITNGVFSSDDLLAQSELMRVEGKGTVDFVTERIDYLLTIYLAKTIDRDRETGLVELADTPIPYRVKGTFANIQQSAALQEIVKTEAKKLLIRELEKQMGDGEPAEGEKEKPADPAKDLLDKGLKSIFGK